MNKVTKTLKSKRGSTEIISSIVVIPVLFVVLYMMIMYASELSKIDNLKQMAQQVARVVSHEGEINVTVNDRLASLEDSMGMDVRMEVDGKYLGGSKKLATESDFTVTLFYDSTYGIGGFINRKETKTYVGKATGTVEEYHK